MRIAEKAALWAASERIFPAVAGVVLAPPLRREMLKPWFYLGAGGCTGDVLIVLQRSREGLERICTSVEAAGRHEHPWGMAEENGPIHVCRGLKTPLAEMWPRVKHWN